MLLERTSIPAYETDASTPNTITMGRSIPERAALKKQPDNCTGIIKANGAAGAGGFAQDAGGHGDLGYAKAMSGWRRWYPL